MTHTLLAALVLASVPAPWSDPPSCHHDVALVGEHVVVDTRWTLGTRMPEQTRAELALALPAAAELDGATAERDEEGRIVALLFDADSDPHVRTRVPLDDVRGHGVLPIPITTASTVQRLSFDAALAFHPDPALGMVTHLGHTATRGLDHDQRRAIDRQLREATLGSFYATTASITREHGLRGELELRADVRRRSALGGAALFVVACGAGVLAYRRSRRNAEAERAEQVLAAEFDALEGDPR